MFGFVPQSIQGVVAVDADEVERSELRTLSKKPRFQHGVVYLVQITPQNQAALALCIHADNGKHPINPPSRFDAQADEEVEGFGQIDRYFLANTVPHHRQGIGKRVGEMFAQQAGAV